MEKTTGVEFTMELDNPIARNLISALGVTFPNALDTLHQLEDDSSTSLLKVRSTRMEYLKILSLVRYRNLTQADPISRPWDAHMELQILPHSAS